MSTPEIGVEMQAEDLPENVQLFALVATATGEVRDAEGNLLNTVETEPQTIHVTREQLREAGMSDEEIDALK